MSTSTRFPARPAGWTFGKTLHASDVYNITRAEPGVRWVDHVSLCLDEIPEKGGCTLVADSFQPGTWYAGSGNILFRSLNDGDGWEATKHFTKEEGILESIRLIRPHPQKPGFIAALTGLEDGSGLHLHLSDDYGETWKESLYPALLAHYPIWFGAWRIPWLCSWLRTKGCSK